MKSLTDIQVDIAFEIDGNATISATSTDWATRLPPINRALIDWAESYEWRSLKKIHNGVVSTSTGNASYALPTDFKKMMGYPAITWDGATTEQFPIVEPERNYTKSANDNYTNVLGNQNSGHVMYIHSQTLASGASVQFPYYAHPASLSTTSQISECPDPSYITQRALYYIYKAREDGRFPEAKVESNVILARMIENENSLGVGYEDRQVPIPPLTNFRVGRDG